MPSGIPAGRKVRRKRLQIHPSDLRTGRRGYPAPAAAEQHAAGMLYVEFVVLFNGSDGTINNRLGVV